MAGARTNSQAARTAVKRSPAATGPRPAPAARTKPPATVAPTARKPRSGSTPRVGRARTPAPSHRRELIALVFFAIAVFLFVILLAGGTGGVLGRGTAAGLRLAFGTLALVVPIALLSLAVTTVFDVTLHRSYWFIGALVFLLGLFLLVAAGAPPFGGHAADYFVRSEFEGRAGGLGEGVYALFHGLAGTVGVAIIGWVAVVAGFSLATGMTIGRLATGTRRAAGAVRDTAERSKTMVKNRGDEAELSELGYFGGPGGAGGGTAAGWHGSPLPASATNTRLGPVDLVGDLATERLGSGTASSPFGPEFDDWADGRPAERSPLAPVSGAAGAVLDGAEAFSDLYGGPSETPTLGGGRGHALPAAAGAGGAAGMGATGAAGGCAGAAAALAAGVGAGAAALAGAAAGGAALAGAAAASGTGAGTATAGGAALHHDGTEAPESGQESLPGLARAPRQIVLPVEQPNYLLPDSELLKKSTPLAPGRANERDTAAVVLQALAQFGVEARVVGMVVGPRVTRYELQLAPGTKVAKVSALKDDLAYALATTEIRILAPIPGKSAVGVEVPNQRPDFVTLGDIYREFPKSAGPLMVWLGKDISGKAVYTDLSRLPHLLIAGTTGSGKSGCVNCIVSSILLRATPELVRLIMIDPKKVELSHYDRIPHLLVPVVTNMKDAAGVLHNVAKEMEDRYELMELEHSRNLADMNKARARRGERPLPFILIVIDELADLMMVSPQEVEEYVIRLAQKSRAVGIHLVVATQRPSADVITGMIKANIPSRIAFAVSSQIDSRVILDVNGAETLLGRGDMLFKPLGSSQMERVQGAFITEEEIALLVNHWRHQAEPEFREELLRRPPDPKEVKKNEDDLFDPDSDDLLADAAQLVIETGSASVSMLQRRLRVGYTRAGRLIDMLERRGIVGPWEGSKPRQILVESDEAEHVLAVLRAEAGGESLTGDEFAGD
jgi:DNA segregation ATPase FtsK/SpoIIIE, S-DNA-T family